MCSMYSKQLVLTNTELNIADFHPNYLIEGMVKIDKIYFILIID